MSEEKAYPEDDCHYPYSTIAINLVNSSKFSLKVINSRKWKTSNISLCQIVQRSIFECNGDKTSSCCPRRKGNVVLVHTSKKFVRSRAKTKRQWRWVHGQDSVHHIRRVQHRHNDFMIKLFSQFIDYYSFSDRFESLGQKPSLQIFRKHNCINRKEFDTRSKGTSTLKCFRNFSRASTRVA